MELQDFKKKGKCCVTGKPMSSSKYMNMVQLQYKAKWDFPTWGNFLAGSKGMAGMAVAFVHDEAIYAGQLLGPVLHAVEFKGEEIIYHEVKTLADA